MTNRRLLWAGLALLTLAVGLAQFGGGAAFERNPNGKAIIETYEIIQDQYLEPIDAKRADELLQGGISGIVGALDDPFTSYSPPRDAHIREEDVRGEFYGIGVQIAPANPDGTGAKIVNVFRGGPAFSAGLKTGDVIVEVDGEDVTQLPLYDIVAKIRGPKDTVVEIGVRRAGANATLRFEITRRKIEIVSVSKAMLPDGVGYVAIETFLNVKVMDQLRQAIADLKAQGAQKLVLDLRDNGGGLLDQGCQVADAFIDQGVIVYTRDRRATRAYCEASPRTLWDGEMVVLVNHGSASASEIVAGAMQDTGRAQVVGEKTFGKGVGQNVFTLSNGGELTLVTFEWLTPKKRSIHEQGITPDVEVRDNRFPTPLAFEGIGAPPGTEVKLEVNGKTYTAVADEDGKFSFSEELPPRELSDVQGEALVDPQHDAILKKALEILNAR
ncbi:S41 family peptidase [Oceanithermus sp.]|uniref:S41 family peptidase n=1 Tax=Oceanithermus sp. TaxID=2268145 RepID=UPI0025FE8FEE|nr:S41 family peptidase [Oceanithermus sp.]